MTPQALRALMALARMRRRRVRWSDGEQPVEPGTERL